MNVVLYMLAKSTDITRISEHQKKDSPVGQHLDE